MRVRCNKADLVTRTRVASPGRGKNIPSLQALLYGATGICSIKIRPCFRSLKILSSPPAHSNEMRR